MPLHFVSGDATRPVGTGNMIIAHCVNDAGGWGSGFVVALSRRWPQPERDYRRWYRTSEFRLGAIKLVPVEQQLWVANMVAQHGYRTPAVRKPLSDGALTECLTALAQQARDLNATVHMPRIGTQRGGAKWKDVEALIAATLIADGVDTTVYDLPS